MVHAVNTLCGTLLLLASWANDERVFGVGGNDLFSILFVVVGLAMIGVGLLGAMASTGPRVTVEVDDLEELKKLREGKRLAPPREED